jgi:copper chaperone
MQTFQVDGMTCGHCVAAVTAELTALAPGSSVEVSLGDGGPSTVTIDGATLTREQVTAALDEAGGYVLISTSGT